MEDRRFDEATKLFAEQGRRTLLKRVAGGLAAGLVTMFGAQDTSAGKCKSGGKPCKPNCSDCCSKDCTCKGDKCTCKPKQQKCRREGHPCEGNQKCCHGLKCRVTGPGNARRCAKPICPPNKCDGSSCKCDEPKDCATGCCKGGYCSPKDECPTCEPKSCTIGYYTQNRCNWPDVITESTSFPCEPAGLTFGKAIEQRGENVVTAQRAAAFLNLELGCYGLDREDICTATNAELTAANEAGTCPLQGCGTS